MNSREYWAVYLRHCLERASHGVDRSKLHPELATGVQEWMETLEVFCKALAGGDQKTFNSAADTFMRKILEYRKRNPGFLTEQATFACDELDRTLEHTCHESKYRVHGTRENVEHPSLKTLQKFSYFCSPENCAIIECIIGDLNHRTKKMRAEKHDERLIVRMVRWHVITAIAQIVWDAVSRNLKKILTMTALVPLAKWLNKWLGS